jgi:hypothetical protein
LTPAKGIHWIELGQWPPLLAVTCDKAAYNRWMKAKGRDSHPFPTDKGGSAQLLTKGPANGILFIALNPKQSERELIISLVHEATHIARFLFEYVKEEHPGVETEAYLVEYIVAESWRELLGDEVPDKAQATA